MRFSGRELLIVLAVALVSWGVPTHGDQQETVPSEDDPVEAWGREWRRAIDLVKAGDREALEVLESLFPRAPDQLRKDRVAYYLVLYGVQDETYFRYLAEQARKTIDSTVPTAIAYDEEGSSTGAFDERFLAWCEKYGVEPADSKREWLPSSGFVYLRITGDPRAFDLFLQGLDSPNLMTVLGSAQALANIGDERAIAPLLQAIWQAPKEMRTAFARSLVFFEDVEAQAVARQLLNNAEMQDRLMERGARDVWKPDTLYEAALEQAKATKARIKKERRLFKVE